VYWPFFSDDGGAAVIIIAAGIAYWVNDLQRRTIVSGAILLALWLGYIVYSNARWFVGAEVVFAPMIAFSTLDARSAKVIAARIAAFAIAKHRRGWQGAFLATPICSSTWGVMGELFHTATDTAFADLLVDGQRETWPIRSVAIMRRPGTL
jgi:hypothetical protein